MYAPPDFYSFPPFYPTYYNCPPPFPPYQQNQQSQQQHQQQQQFNHYQPSPPIVPAPLTSPIHPLTNTVPPAVSVTSLSSHISNSSPKTLPTVTHIPILSGRSDFGAWHDGVRALIQHLGYTGHISTTPASGVILRPDRIPTYHPVLMPAPTVDELAAYKLWWECDNVVTHILLSRLHSTVRAILPSDDNDDSPEPRTSRVVYLMLRKSYGVHGHASGSALLAELRALQCGPRVTEYVTKWRGGISQLCSARHPFSMRDVLEGFLDRLPVSVPYQILCFKYMDCIDAIAVDDISTFFKVTDEVLDIDSMHKRLNPTSSQRNSSTVPRFNPTQSAVPSTVLSTKS
jgi:hypothetical protein